jgi:hypothetical protein
MVGENNQKDVISPFCPVPSLDRVEGAVQEAVLCSDWEHRQAYCDTLDKLLQLCISFSISKIRNMIVYKASPIAPVLENTFLCYSYCLILYVSYI